MNKTNKRKRTNSSNNSSDDEIQMDITRNTDSDTDTTKNCKYNNNSNNSSNDETQLQIKELKTKLDELQQQNKRIVQFNRSMYQYIGNLEQQFWTARFPPKIKPILCGAIIETNDKQGECVRDILHTGPCYPYRQADDSKINNYDKSLNYINTKWTQQDKTMFSRE